MHRLLDLGFLVAALLCVATTAARAEVAVRDDAGYTIALAAPAQRIVSLAPHVTELLFDIGAGDRLVGATAHSDYPPAAARIPRVGGLAGIDVESIVALRPDLVIAWQSGTSSAQIEQLVRLHIPVFRSEPHSLSDVADTLRRFGELTGHAGDAHAAADAFDAGVATLRKAYAGRRSVRVFYQVWDKPLMTIGGPQLITQVIELCGGRNVFASLTMLAPTVDVEAVIEADPQLIVTSSEGGRPTADVATWDRWTSVAAVRDRRYLFLDPATILRHTPRLLIGADALCRAIDATRSGSRPVT